MQKIFFFFGSHVSIKFRLKCFVSNFIVINPFRCGRWSLPFSQEHKILCLFRRVQHSSLSIVIAPVSSIMMYVCIYHIPKTWTLYIHLFSFEKKNRCFFSFSFLSPFSLLFFYEQEQLQKQSISISIENVPNIDCFWMVCDVQNSGSP